MENGTCWRCIPYWKWGFSIAMLVYWRVSITSQFLKIQQKAPKFFIHWNRFQKKSSQQLLWEEAMWRKCDFSRCMWGGCAYVWVGALDWLLKVFGKSNSLDSSYMSVILILNKPNTDVLCYTILLSLFCFFQFSIWLDASPMILDAVGGRCRWPFAPFSSFRFSGNQLVIRKIHENSIHKRSKAGTPWV